MRKIMVVVAILAIMLAAVTIFAQSTTQIGAVYPLANGYQLVTTTERHVTWTELRMAITDQDGIVYGYEASNSGNVQLTSLGQNPAQYIFGVQIDRTLQQSTICQIFIPTETAAATTPVVFGCSS